MEAVDSMSCSRTCWHLTIYQAELHSGGQRLYKLIEATC